MKKRPEVTLKTGGFGRRHDRPRGAGAGRRSPARCRARQVHLMRAEADAVMIGIGTALADDPDLTCRLPGLEARSPARIVLDRRARLAAPARDWRARPGMCRSAGSRRRRPSRARKAELCAAHGVHLPGRRESRRPHRVAGTARRSCRARDVDACLSKAARRRRGTFWPRGSGRPDRAVRRARSRSGRAALPRRFDRTRMPAGFALIAEARYGDDRLSRNSRRAG